MAAITEDHLIDSIADALRFISSYHPRDFVQAMRRAWETEQSPAARGAIVQILVNSRMATMGKRPLCQDTGVANVHVAIGVQARLDWHRSLHEIVEDAVRRAIRLKTNLSALPWSLTHSGGATTRATRPPQC